MLLRELATIVNSPAPLHALHVGTEQGIHQRDEAVASQRQERGGCCCATALHADPSACCSSACAILPLPHPCSSCSVQLQRSSFPSSWEANESTGEERAGQLQEQAERGFCS